MSGFGEHVDRSLYLQHHEYHHLIALLAGVPDETFAALFPDYAGWRTARAEVRLRETERISVLAAMALEGLRAMAGRAAPVEPAPPPAPRPHHDETWRMRMP